MPEGDVHMERGGRGASCYSTCMHPTVTSPEMLDEAGNALKTLTIESVLKQCALKNSCLSHWRCYFRGYPRDIAEFWR